MADDIDDLSDGQPGPDKEPKSSKAWLTMITDAEKAFREYQDKADNIDKLYANLDRLANTTRDRQFQLFWANIQVLAPSIYSRPPVPVVVPRFKDRKPLPRVTSELLERSSVVMFELEDIDAVMRLVRDDLVILARGCVWVRYEAKGEDNFSERVCIEHVDRKDFLHDPARTWKEVDWVSRASYLTKPEMRKRFKKHSSDTYKDAAYEDRKTDETDDGKLKAKVHEIWSKSLNKVVWVSEGCEKLLDEDDPHLTLDGFFPCPRPAYATVQRRSLVPVPDMVFYKDQLEEINELTARIGALTEAVKVRGFYQAGAGEVGDAVEAAVKATTNNVWLSPLATASLTGQAFKDAILWMPLEMIAATIVQLVELRKQLIDDVYQITGLSDIMRGSTVASETLGAQELKSQYGSTRIKDRQAELVRIARDITRIAAEIMAENFQSKTLLEMSQLDIETDAQCKAQYAPLEQQLAQIVRQVQQAQNDPEVMQMAQQNPEQAQKVMAQAQQQAQQLQQQIAKAKEKPTVEKVMAFLRDNRLRPFVLDIETDSTIAPDENATKQRATEYVTAVGGFMNQALPLVQAIPQSAPVVADVLKFAAAQFRAGRQVEASIEEFADQMKAMASQPKPPDPEQAKAQAEAQATQMAAQTEAMRVQGETAEKQANAQKTAMEAEGSAMEARNKLAEDEQVRKIKLAEAVDAARARSADIEAKAQLTDLERLQKTELHAQAVELGELNIELLETKISQAEVQTNATLDLTDAKIEQGEVQAGEAPGEAEAPRRKKRPKHRSLRTEVSDSRTAMSELLNASMAEMLAGREATNQVLADVNGKLDAVAAQIVAPVELIRDRFGTAVQVRKGERVMDIVNDTAGRVQGMQ